MVQLNMFDGFKFGDQGHSFSHLQFADDTLIVGDSSVQNLWVIKSILQLFELVSELKVNFHKSQLFVVNVEDSWLQTVAMELNCKWGCLPFNYLGITIGANPKKLSTWKPVIDKVKGRLYSWKYRHLSFGGQVVIIKLVLSALPTYYPLSFGLHKVLSLPSNLFFKIFVGWERGEKENSLAGLG